MKKILIILAFIYYANEAKSQATAVFSFEDNACLNQNIALENASINASRYEWDFCTGDFLLSPNLSLFVTNAQLANVNGLKIYSDSLYSPDRYVFIPSRNSKQIYKYKLNDQLEIPTSSPIGIIPAEVILNQPVAIDIVRFEGLYFGYFTDIGANKLYEIQFGNDLDNTPISITDLGNFSTLNQPFDLRSVVDENKIKILVSNFNSSIMKLIERQDDGSYLASDINVGNTAAWGIDLIKYKNNWLLGVSFASINTVRFFEFNGFLDTSPETTYSFTNPLMLASGNVKFVVDKSEVSTFVQSNNGGFGRISFGEHFNISASYSHYGNFGVLNSITRGFDIVKNKESKWQVLIVQSSNVINKIQFPNVCEIDIKTSNIKEPLTLFSQPGTYPITLTSFSDDGNSSSITKEITVTNNSAPEIDFETGTNLCITDPISFTGISNETINSWNWDFGDGATATGQNPEFTFASPGTYDVTLVVEGANGCNNRIQKSITVYEPQPVTFNSSAQGAICSQKPILFDNTTDLPAIATYDWSFGDGNTSTLENPEHVYATSGNYVVGLTVFVAGCESYAEQTITVNPGPAVSFATVDNCLGQIISFQNTSSGEFITGYLWDFGDGTTSTQENPEYAFETAGTQMIELTAFTSNGCDFTIQQEIEVYPVAVVDFANDIACSTQPIQFTEEVFLELSNVTNYLWDFGIAGSNTDISTEPNPQFSFPEPGTYQVSLQVTTADGCVSQGQKSVTVEAIPETSFSCEPQCVGSTINFVGNTNENISANFWELQNNLGEVLAVGSQGDFSYTFNNSGIYRLRYRQQNSQLCSNEYEEMIEILPNPAPNFIFSQSCAGQPIVFQNNTELFGNSVESYSWNMGGEATLNNENPEFTFEEPGTYEVTLEVNTLTGCTETFTQNIEVKPLPDVAFTLEQTVGAYPFQVNATVAEQADFVYQWTINGMIVSEEANLEETLQEAGNYIIALSATNSEGCTNTFSQQVRVRVPEMDIALGNLRVVPQGDVTGFVVTMTNRGSLIPDFIDLDVDLGKFSITERVDRVISPETSVNYVMRLNLTESQLRGLSKICLNAKVVSSVFVEEKTDNNRACTNLEDAFRVMDIYPNPARASITVPVIIPNSGDVMVIIEQSDGKQTDNLRFELSAGYNEVKIDRGNLKSGIYFIRFRFEGIEKVKKVVFQ